MQRYGKKQKEQRKNMKIAPSTTPHTGHAVPASPLLRATPHAASREHESMGAKDFLIPILFAVGKIGCTFAPAMTLRTLLLLLLVWPLALCAQTNAPARVNPEDREVDMDNPTFVPMIRVGKVQVAGDSIQYVEMNNVWVFSQPVFKNDKQRAAYNRLVFNIKKVLPIAKEVNKIIIETGDYLETLPNKRARDQHMKRVEESIKKEYTPRMKKLSYSQGKLLIRLVYRECNSSSYELIKGFLGPIRAGFYQAFAWVFGASLKKEYDPNGVDRLTERIVLQVEAGQL